MENKVRNQEKIPDFIQRIDDILKNNSHLLSDNEITELRNEKIRL